MDTRLAPLRDEIDKIMSSGPVGSWTNPPTTFAMISESVVFNAGGWGLIVSRSGMLGESRQQFVWSMHSRGRLAMRFRSSDHDERPFGPAEEPDDRDRAMPVFFDIEIKILETEFGPWPVMTTRSSDTFGCLWCALVRDDPPLVLPQRPRAVRLKQTLLSRIRDLARRI
jgi:hypothetical protein